MPAAAPARKNRSCLIVVIVVAVLALLLVCCLVVGWAARNSSGELDTIRRQLGMWALTSGLGA